MNISLLSTAHLGGVKTHAWTLSRHLTRNHDVHLFTGDSGPLEGVNCYQVPSFFFHSYEHWYNKPRIIQSLKSIQPDVIHIHHQFSNLDFFLSTLKRCGPLVSTVHLTPSRRTWVDQLLYLYFRRFTRQLASTDHVIAVSRQVQRGLERLGVESSLIPNGIDTSLFKPQPQEPSETKTILFVGRLSLEKGIHHLIKAVKQLKTKARLVVIGKGPLAPWCRLAARRHPNITFLGKVSFSTLRKWYAKADVTVVPSIWEEAFGLVVIESLASGTPVVAYPSGAIPDLLSEKTGSLVTKKNPRALATELDRFLTSDERKEKECVRAASKYDWKKIVPQIENIYRSVV